MREILNFDRKQLLRNNKKSIIRIYKMFELKNIDSQKGKISLVTGANSGIGFETTLGLVKTGMKVIMACRNKLKAENAKKTILASVPQADLEIMLLDLSSLNSVKSFAAEFLAAHNKLDILINNAGIMVPPYSKTEDGFESQMGSNYFGHFLLTGLLMDCLNKTPHARIVSLSSLAHKRGRIDFTNLHAERYYSKMVLYGQSKLACLMFAYALQRKLNKTDSTTLSVAAHPGVSNTELWNHIPKLAYYALLPIFSLFSQSPDKAALPILMAALDPHISGGDYYGPTGFKEMKGTPGKVQSLSHSHDVEVAKKLWEISEELTHISYAL
jgi:NAD(P)-dependent dehydrogenase (short-subunit alcohol dehydrogenase family)